MNLASISIESPKRILHKIGFTHRQSKWHHHLNHHTQTQSEKYYHGVHFRLLQKNQDITFASCKNQLKLNTI